MNTFELHSLTITALSRARHLVPVLGGATALSAIPLFALTDVIIPFLYGPSFAPATPSTEC